MPVASWITEARLIADHPDTSYADGAAERGIVVASEVLYNLSGRRFPGEQTDTIRPHCRHLHWAANRYDCHGGSGLVKLPGYPVIVRDAVVADPDADPPVEAVAASPVVTLEGEAFTGFVVYDERYVARTDGLSWPCQAMPRDDDPPSVMITYAWGRTPTAGGQAACSALAHQYALTMTPALADTCALPPRVASVARQGITISVTALVEEGRTGLDDVDLWLDSLRVGDVRAGAGLVVPGTSNRYRRA